MTNPKSTFSRSRLHSELFHWIFFFVFQLPAHIRVVSRKGDCVCSSFFLVYSASLSVSFPMRELEAHYISPRERKIEHKIYNDFYSNAEKSSVPPPNRNNGFGNIFFRFLWCATIAHCIGLRKMVKIRSSAFFECSAAHFSHSNERQRTRSTIENFVQKFLCKYRKLCIFNKIQTRALFTE